MSNPPTLANLPAPPVSIYAAPSQSSAPAAPPLLLGRSGYLTSSFGMVLAAVLLVATLALKNKIDPNLSGILLLGLPAVYAYLRNERALGHAKLNADIITGALTAAGAQVLAVKAPALLSVLNGPDTNGQARVAGQSDNQTIGQSDGKTREALQADAVALKAQVQQDLRDLNAGRDIELATKAGGAVAPPGLAICILISLSLALFGCSTTTGDPKADTRGRVTNAVLQDVFNIALQGAISAGAAALQGQNGQDAARAAFESAALPAGVNIIHDVITAYAGPQAAPIAQAADAAIALAKPTTAAEKAAVLNTIGAAIQTAANQAF